METFKRTVLFQEHVRLKATMVDFGGWEMPVHYPAGIVEEHLYTRKKAGVFDVSHMGRFVITGKEMVKFLQYVLTNNVLALDLKQAQYTMIPNEQGGALDDAYLYRFYAHEYLLVVNASNAEKDWAHLTEVIKGFDAQITNQSEAIAMISLQGPEAKNILQKLSGNLYLTEPEKNALNIIELAGKEVWIAKTGYTGEPIGFELFVKSHDAVAIWSLLIEKGAMPIGLGARDTLRLEAGLPLYGHELGMDLQGEEIPIYAVPLAKFAVSYAEAKGDFIGRKALWKQFEAFQKIMKRDFSRLADLPRVIKPIALSDKGIARNGYQVFKNGVEVGYVTSGTMVPYYKTEGHGLETVIKEETGLRAIGLALVNSDVLVDDQVEVEIRGKKVPAVIPPYHMRGDAPPFARPIIYGFTETYLKDTAPDYQTKALNLIEKSYHNHLWRQEACINLIPSEQSHSRAVRLLSITDPSFRYAEHKKIKSFYEADVFYYQGTKFIDEVEHLLVEEFKKYFHCLEVETRVISGQMANTAVFSALMDFKNKGNRKKEADRLGYILNNHIIRGGHLSAQPMGALHDYIALDPITEKPAVVNFPVLKDNPYKIDVEETKKIITQYKPELIIFGKSMVLHKEPVREIREFINEQKLDTVIMYDMAHVLGLIGDYFQNPFAEGAEIVTGSTHKTFFGTQRGVIAANYPKEELKYELWETIETRAFPGSVSNHHLGTLLGLLMAAYEMNHFKDTYQKNIIENAKHFAKSLKQAGLDVAGDADISYTETHQVIVKVGYGTGPEVANRLEENNIIVNYQATPEEEGFTASGALRLGVGEMTRFGFGKKEFDQLSELMADVILRKKNVKEEVKKLRSGFTDMKYCFTDEEIVSGLDKLANGIGL
ncbi:glycine cleavage system aminomethyltransferase GcvT [Candidatus Formimonas warabiya]|uniref:Glycine cleavage system protein T n=1 Tax=Formimonas warabiya TaxID=1761012 RepID=A0A3G1KSQ0_FORW1|nr:glycine cleavage system aminomethyltransferase GcvT [Candidatus Formimonas warabiya]ATW25457.1 glycine cleavage system protein T [Candidatus Formimonas warabiya]